MQLSLSGLDIFIFRLRVKLKVTDSCHDTLSFYTWHVLKQGIKQNLTVVVSVVVSVVVYWFQAFLSVVRMKMSTDKYS
ncbi:hypothetical protein BGI09_04925 [Snodgrassella alvi]|nr:hypothetical protein BGI09_04925 [Snodgrassella alvi]